MHTPQSEVHSETHPLSYRVTPLLAFAALLVAPIGSSCAESAPDLDVPFVPTPMPVVERMLELADPKPGDYLIDLGSGDGRIPITAAKTYGVSALGVDLDPNMVAEGKRNARDEGVADNVTFRQEDLFDTDIAKADVLTMYLLQRVNEQLKPRILSEMKPGARIVSHAFTMPGWKPDHEETVNGRNIYMWIVPTRSDGRWVIDRGAQAFEISIRTDDGKTPSIEAKSKAGGESLSAKDLRIQGEQLSFEIDIDGERHRFQGRLDNGALVDLSSDRGGAWTARPA